MKAQTLVNVSNPVCRLILIGAAGLLLLGGCNKQPENNTASKQSAASPAPNPAPGAPGATAAPAPPPPAAGAPQAPIPSQEAAAPPPNSATASATQPPAAAQPAPAAPKIYTVPAGARVAVRLSESISAKANNVGDEFRGVLAEPVRVNGVTVLRAGTPVTGTVVAAKGQGRFKGAGTLAIELSSIGSRPVTTSAYEQVDKGKGKRTAGFIGGGGGAGALIGGLAGGGKGALIGGLLGAGAGTAGAGLTGNKNVVIPAETVVPFRLRTSLRVPAGGR